YSAIASGTHLAEIRAAGILFPILLTLILVISGVAFWQKKNFLTFSILAYSGAAVSLSFKKVWVHVGNAERQTYESFLLLLILFLSFRQHTWLKYVYAVFCIILFLYDFFIFSVFDSFRSGLLGLIPGLWG